MNIGASEEFIDLEVEKSMEIWCESNPDFIGHLEFDLDMFSNSELTILMNSYAEIEDYEKAQEIKNFIQLRS